MKEKIIDSTDRLIKKIGEASDVGVEEIKTATKMIGPGVITGFSDDDPGGIGTYSITGARFGLGMNWLLIVQIPLMIAIQEICARIGLVTGHGLAGNIKKHYTKPILFLIILILVGANIFNIGADISAMSASMNLIMGGNITFWAIFVTIVIILLEVFISYRIYANILKWLTIFFLSYLLTLFAVPQNWSEIGRSLISFHWQSNGAFVTTLVAFLGTTISPYLFFWQASEEVEERMQDKQISHKFVHPKMLTKMRWDTALGMILSQIIAFSIIVTCATVLNKNGITEIASAQDAASALRPLVGDMAGIFFTIGIVGAGLLGIPVLAGSAAYALSEALGWREGLFHKFKEASGFYGIIIVSTLIGLGVNFIGIDPIKGLFYSAVLNGVVAVPLIAILVTISSRKDVMGKYVNRPISKIFGWLTFAIMLVAVVAMFVYL